MISGRKGRVTDSIYTLREILSSPMITTTGHALSGLEEYQGKGAGLMDRLIRMNYLDSVHQVVSFDKAVVRLSNCAEYWKIVFVSSRQLLMYRRLTAELASKARGSRSTGNCQSHIVDSREHLC